MESCEVVVDHAYDSYVRVLVVDRNEKYWVKFADCYNVKLIPKDVLDRYLAAEKLWAAAQEEVSELVGGL